VARPTEYDNLLKIGQLKEAESSQDSINQFVQIAQDMLVDARTNTRTSTKFYLAYEGMFNIVMAVLEFYGTRPGDGAGHRATTIARVAVDLGLSDEKQSALRRLHELRNRVTYRKPIPPATNADASAMESLLAVMLPASLALMNPPAQT
jgi:hypothetical protein